MYSLCFGLLLVGWSVAAYASQTEADFLDSRPDTLTIQPIHEPPAYRSSPGTVLAHSTDNVPSGLAGIGKYRLPSAAAPKKQANWTPNPRWQLISISDNGRILLSPIPLYESTGEKLEIKARLNSVWMQWRKALP